jgi:hypothetical protein
MKTPIGKIINISHKNDVQVVAIIKDFPEQSILSGDLICSTELRIRYSRSCSNGNCTYFYKTLVKLNDNTPESLSEKLTKIISSTYTINPDENLSYALFPYKGAYFDTSLSLDDLKHAKYKSYSPFNNSNMYPVGSFNFQLYKSFIVSNFYSE